MSNYLGELKWTSFNKSDMGRDRQRRVIAVRIRKVKEGGTSQCHSIVNYWVGVLPNAIELRKLIGLLY
jgi:hypothetical protein